MQQLVNSSWEKAPVNATHLIPEGDNTHAAWFNHSAREMSILSDDGGEAIWVECDMMTLPDRDGNLYTLDVEGYLNQMIARPE